MYSYKSINCPNCNAPLSADGHCEYCGTTVKRTNQIDIKPGEQLELNLMIKEGNMVKIIPLVGRIDTVEARTNSIDYYSGKYNNKIGAIYGNTEVSFNFNGAIRNDL